MHSSFKCSEWLNGDAPATSSLSLPSFITTLHSIAFSQTIPSAQTDNGNVWERLVSCTGMIQVDSDNDDDVAEAAFIYLETDAT